MTREIQVGDYVKVVKKSSDTTYWTKTMDGFIDKYRLHEVLEVGPDDDGGIDVLLENYYFPLECVELDFSSSTYTNPVTPKTIYSRTDSYETYDTEKEALIAHFDDTIRALVLYRSNFNINTVIENQDKLIEVLKMMQSFNLEEMDEL